MKFGALPGKVAQRTGQSPLISATEERYLVRMALMLSCTLFAFGVGRSAASLVLVVEE